LNNIRIERALRQEIRAADFGGLCLEQVDKGAADEFALFLWVGDAREARHERLLRIHGDQRNVVMVAEERDDLLCFIEPHQTVIDIDAGKLFADCLVNKDRSDRAVDAA